MRNFCHKMAAAAILDDQKSLSIAFLAISDQYSTFNFRKFMHGGRRPFWMIENDFRSHFSPFQVNTQLLVLGKLCTKWPPVAILDDRKSFSIAFLEKSDKHFFKWPPAAILNTRLLPKLIGTSIYSRSVAISNMKLMGAFLIKLSSAQDFSSYFHKMPAGGHFVFSDYLQNR